MITDTKEMAEFIVYFSGEKTSIIISLTHTAACDYFEKK